MNATATLTSKAQITIPKKTRHEMGLKEGDLIHFEADGQGGYRITRKQETGKAWGILADRFAGDEPVSVAQMKDAIKKHHADRFAKGRT